MTFPELIKNSWFDSLLSVEKTARGCLGFPRRRKIVYENLWSIQPIVGVRKRGYV